MDDMRIAADICGGQLALGTGFLVSASAPIWAIGTFGRLAVLGLYHVFFGD